MTDTELPAGVPGLNVDDGLRRAMGKWPLYISMLRKFVAGQKTMCARVEQALGAGDWKTAERLAHTTKGGAGTIGARELQSAAGALESALGAQRPRDEIDSLLAAIGRKLSPMIEALEQALPPEPSSATQVEVDSETLKALCARLDALLANDDAEAGDVIDANRELLNAAFPEYYRKIQDAIRGFDFETALDALRAAMVTRTGA